MVNTPRFELAEPIVVLDLGLDFWNKRVETIGAIKLYPSMGNDIDYYFTNNISKTTLMAFFDWTEGAAVAMYGMPKQLSVLYTTLKECVVMPSCKPAWRFDIIRLALRSFKSDFPEGYKAEQVARYLGIDTNIISGYTRVHMLVCILLELMQLNQKKFVRTGFKAAMQKDIKLVWMPIGTHTGKRIADLPEHVLRYELLSSNTNNENLPELYSSITNILEQRAHA